MKYIIPTYMRVGSTLVSEALALLTDEVKNFVEGSVDELLSADGIVKTHSKYAVDFLEVAKENKDFHVVYVYRNFKDVLVSRLLYEKNVRTKQNLSICRPAKLILDTYDQIDDKVFLDLVIETNLQWIYDEALLWRRSVILIQNPQFTRINYDKIADSLDILVATLGKLVGASTDKQQQTLTKIRFSEMQKRHTAGFLRTGRVGDHKRMLSQASINLLNQLITSINNKQVL